MAKKSASDNGSTATLEAPEKPAKKKKAKPELELNAGIVETESYHLVDPNEIVVGEDTQSRYTDHTEQDVEIIYRDIKNGDRIAPIVVRRIADNKLEVVAGRRRLAAYLKYNEEFPDKAKKIACFIDTDLDDEQALALDVKTNAHAKTYSPLDLHRISQKFQNDHNWKAVRVAKLLNVHNTYLSQLKQLDGCSDAVKDAIHEGRLALNAGFSLAKNAPKEDQDDIIEKAATYSKPKKAEGQPDGYIDSSAVAKALREYLDLKNPPADSEDEETEGEEAESGEETKDKEDKKPTTEYPPLTLKQVKEYLENKSGPGEKPSVKKLAGILYNYITGQISEVIADKRIDKLFPDEKAGNDKASE